MTVIHPDCQIPDGAEPCAGFKELLEENERLKARLNGLRLPFAPVDDIDWEYLLGPHAIGQGGRDQFWREVLRQTRAALGIYG